MNYFFSTLKVILQIVKKQITHYAREFFGGSIQNGIIFWDQFFLGAVFRGAYFLGPVFPGEYFPLLVEIFRGAIRLGGSFPPVRLCDI